MSQPELLIGGGPNGAGKTTFALGDLTEHSLPDLGADAIAAEFSPEDPEIAAIPAGEDFFRIHDDTGIDFPQRSLSTNTIGPWRSLIMDQPVTDIRTLQKASEAIRIFLISRN